MAALIPKCVNGSVYQAARAFCRQEILEKGLCEIPNFLTSTAVTKILSSAERVKGLGKGFRSSEEHNLLELFRWPGLRGLLQEAFALPKLFCSADPLGGDARSSVGLNPTVVPDLKPGTLYLFAGHRSLHCEKEKGIRYRSFSEQVVRHVEEAAVKKKMADEQERSRLYWEKEEQRAKVRYTMNLPKCEGGLYWQPNIHYIPASIKFGDQGEVIVTGGPPPDAKVNKASEGREMAKERMPLDKNILAACILKELQAKGSEQVQGCSSDTESLGTAAEREPHAHCASALTKDPFSLRVLPCVTPERRREQLTSGVTESAVGARPLEPQWQLMNPTGKFKSSCGCPLVSHPITVGELKDVRYCRNTKKHKKTQVTEALPKYGSLQLKLTDSSVCRRVFFVVGSMRVGPITTAQGQVTTQVCDLPGDWRNETPKFQNQLPIRVEVEA
eukprot:g32142.t1